MLEPYILWTSNSQKDRTYLTLMSPCLEQISSSTSENGIMNQDCLLLTSETESAMSAAGAEVEAQASINRLSLPCLTTCCTTCANCTRNIPTFTPTPDESKLLGFCTLGVFWGSMHAYKYSESGGGCDRVD